MNHSRPSSPALSDVNAHEFLQKEALKVAELHATYIAHERMLGKLENPFTNVYDEADKALWSYWKFGRTGPRRIVNQAQDTHETFLRIVNDYLELLASPAGQEVEWAKKQADDAREHWLREAFAFGLRVNSFLDHPHNRREDGAHRDASYVHPAGLSKQNMDFWVEFGRACRLLVHEDPAHAQDQMYSQFRNILLPHLSDLLDADANLKQHRRGFDLNDLTWQVSALTRAGQDLTKSAHAVKQLFAAKPHQIETSKSPYDKVHCQELEGNEVAAYRQVVHKFGFLLGIETLSPEHPMVPITKSSRGTNAHSLKHLSRRQQQFYFGPARQ
ncbi:uncharacterized protein JCM15063_002905 [Sporobolomyces koalae]|uniref:uncharacterized protein n=1 Tax=Sporobolomyces koalae TaxID=500713 RepID=UPI0031812A62